MVLFGRIAASLCLLVTAVGTATKVSEAQAKAGLRPHGWKPHREAKHSSRLPRTEPVKQPAPASPAPSAALVDTGVAAAASQPYELNAEVEPAQATGEDSSAMLKGLRQELTEMKQRRVNIASLQQALAADVALLRESASLQRVSSNQRDKAVAAQQVRQSEQIVKDTGAMLRESRMAALKDAQAVLRDQSQLQQALEALKTEAAEQLQAFSSSGHSGESSSESTHFATAPEARPSLPSATSLGGGADTVAAATAAAADDGDDDP